MIISASRRTDIPAFYGPWLLNRLRAGFALVRNPFNSNQVTRVPLDPNTVDALVLWTKNPAPLLRYLPEIEALGYRYLFHFTLTGCHGSLEPYLPPLEERIATFRRLAERLGAQRVLWRFDPILCTADQPPQQVLATFNALAGALAGSTCQCTISFLTLYAKCRRNLATVPLLTLKESEKRQLIRELIAIAAGHKLTLKACCDTFLQQTCGIESAHCIDARQLAAIWPEIGSYPADKGQRAGCGCVRSVDIGAYDSCIHGCRYCYATVNERLAAARYAAHDPNGPLLLGTLTGTETIRPANEAGQKRIPTLLACLHPAGGSGQGTGTGNIGAWTPDGVDLDSEDNAL